jgi:hypothetical protein
MITQKAPTNPKLENEYLRQLAYTINRAIDDSNVLAVNAVSATQDLNAGYGLVLVDASAGAVDLNLPPFANVPGRKYTLVKIDSSGNAAAFAADGSETISGSASASTSTQWGRVTICSCAPAGTGWVIV